MANGMSGTPNILGQLLGGAMSAASAIPTAVDRAQRQTALGEEDPALAVLRRRLAQQNAQTAMTMAQTQQGANPALAARQAQQALAQTQIGTNADLARQQVAMTQQARQQDMMGRRRDAALQGAGQLFNLLGTGLTTQEAGLRAASQDQALGSAPQFNQMLGGDTGLGGVGGMMSPLVGQVGDDDGFDFNLLNQEPGASSFDLGFLDNVTQGFSGQPADILGAGTMPQQQVQAGVDQFFQNQMTGVPTQGDLAAQRAEEALRQGLQGLRIPDVTGQMPAQVPSQVQVPGTVVPQFDMPAAPDMTQAQRTAPTQADVMAEPEVPQPRQLPQSVVSDPRNSALVRSYENAIASGDRATADAIYNILTLFEGF